MQKYEVNNIFFDFIANNNLLKFYSNDTIMVSCYSTICYAS